ncbi:hypothetical protein [Filimonas effusa]|uniref:Uncharacterized protein n=1 Tax=Filimonas effusa TaxID=2508721 RepID=A0A4Q1D9M0_9BACT|nr:hypothetical protein [Filimonas effusa]RXK86082.1 hypothetical protein ESB13_04530 [Filimonas effusa]
MVLVGGVMAFSSCNKLKRKAGSIAHKVSQRFDTARERIGSKKDEIIDKTFPAYDAWLPDTDNNKKRFAKHLQVDLTGDVKNIYAYGDFLGADYKVLLCFRCAISTIDKIVKTKQMKPAEGKGPHGLVFSVNLPWWDELKLTKLRPYKVGKADEYQEFLWYDKKTQTAYYEEFSL